MVTNKDECVTVKSPSMNVLVQNVYCNWSGGSAMGSLGTDVAVSKITYSNVYTWMSNQMYLVCARKIKIPQESRLIFTTSDQESWWQRHGHRRASGEFHRYAS